MRSPAGTLWRYHRRVVRNSSRPGDESLSSLEVRAQLGLDLIPGNACRAVAGSSLQLSARNAGSSMDHPGRSSETVSMSSVARKRRSASTIPSPISARSSRVAGIAGCPDETSSDLLDALIILPAAYASATLFGTSPLSPPAGEGYPPVVVLEGGESSLEIGSSSTVTCY